MRSSVIILAPQGLWARKRNRRIMIGDHITKTSVEYRTWTVTTQSQVPDHALLVVRMHSALLWCVTVYCEKAQMCSVQCKHYIAIRNLCRALYCESLHHRQWPETHINLPVFLIHLTRWPALISDLEAIYKRLGMMCEHAHRFPNDKQRSVIMKEANKANELFLESLCGS